MKLPQPKQIKNLKIIEPEKIILDNGVELFYINTGSIQVAKLALIFTAGNWFESKSLTSDMLAQMLNEGTKTKSNKQINEIFESNGVSFEVDQTEDRIEVSISGLAERLSGSFDLLLELLTECSFPEKEFSTVIDLNKQAIKNRDENVSSLGGLKFLENLYGSSHPYGFIETAENLSKLKPSDLLDFYNKALTSKNVYLVLAGKFDKSLLKKVNDNFGKNNWQKDFKESNPSYKISQSSEKRIAVGKKDAVQSAINIGYRSINKLHSDYPKVRILNHILGGSSLGSRLMLNIREEKGLTYGIYSEFKTMERDGFFRVRTELKKESVNLAIEEIYKEMNILKNDLVPEKELTMVRNFLLGMFLQSINGPFGLMDAFIAIKNYNLDYDYYQKLLSVLNTITADEIRDLANQYFIQEKFKEVIVG